MLIGVLRALMVLSAYVALLVPSGAGPRIASVAYPIAAGSDGECTVKVDNVHASTHQPGTTNVVATMTCKGRKPHISSTVVLDRASNAGGWEQVGVGYGGADGVSRLAVNAAWGRCINGIQMRGRALFSYTTDGTNTFSVEGTGPISTVDRCP